MAMSSTESLFNGKWRNERGSEMVLRLSRGKVTGTYVTQIGDKRALSKSRPLVGQAHLDVIGFVVAWPEVGSLTSWAGRLVIKRGRSDSIHTVWHLVRPSKLDSPADRVELWASFLTNSSVFRRIPE